MNTEWQLAGQTLQLFRFPPNQHDKSLQAWDSADEYAIEYISENYADDSTNRPVDVIICNDAFGALTIGLHGLSPICVTDSFIAHQAIDHNCTQNNLTAPLILNSLAVLPKSQLVVIKLSKNLDYLKWQLSQVQAMASAHQIEVNIVATGKTTLVTSSVMKTFETLCQNVSSSLAKKKSRLIFATVLPEHISSSTLNEDETQLPPYQAKCPELSLTLSAHANVFCKDQIDIGGRFLVEHMPELPSSTESINIIDLGCGNGLLGVSFLRQNQQQILKSLESQQVNVTFCDESFMAIQSAQYNVKANTPELIDICQFVQDDCLTQQKPESADLILCNPPFHQQQAVTTHIAEQMIQHAKTTLKPGAELYLVANRHLPYQGMLKKQFGGFRVVANNNKFTLYHCIKRKT